MMSLVSGPVSAYAVDIAQLGPHLNLDSNELQALKTSLTRNLDRLSTMLEKLESLGEVMGSILEQQRKSDVRFGLLNWMPKVASLTIFSLTLRNIFLPCRDI